MLACGCRVYNLNFLICIGNPITPSINLLYSFLAMILLRLGVIVLWRPLYFFLIAPSILIVCGYGLDTVLTISLMIAFGTALRH